MGTENLGPSLTSEGRIHSIGRITFPRVDYFSGLLGGEAKCVCHAAEAVRGYFAHVRVMRGSVVNVSHPDAASDGGDGVGEGEGAFQVPGGGVGGGAAVQEILGP